MMTMRRFTQIITTFLLIFTVTSTVSAQSRDKISDVMIHRQAYYGFIVNGGYSQWEYGTLYTQSAMGSLSMLYALHPNINVYAGIGANSFILEDPAIADSRFTQNIHLDYHAGALLSLGFLYTDLSWRYNPVSGETEQTAGVNTYRQKADYSFHDFAAKLGVKFANESVVLAGGVYQHAVVGDQTRKVYRVQGDSENLVSSKKVDFSERSPLAAYGTAMYKLSPQYSVGFDVIFRDADNFIIQLTYLKIAF